MRRLIELKNRLFSNLSKTLTIFGNYALISKVISDKQQAISNAGYRKLIAWQKSDLLAHKIYEITETFPKSEIFGLTSQLRRAALSIPANIIEGYARVSKNEFHHFLSITLGSLAELDYFLDFAVKQKLLKEADFRNAFSLKEECGRLIWRLYQSQK